MDTSPQIEPTSKSRLLACLGLRIDKTKLLRTINNSSAMIRQLESEDPSSHRLLFLKKEIANLETRLASIRRKATSNRTAPDLSKLK